MKIKSLIILSFLLVSLGSKAQKAAVQTAFNYLRYDDLDKAKEAIDGAVVNETTMGYAKAWYYRGSIYQSIFESKKEKFAALKPGSLEEARKSYEKTLELDTKGEFSEDVIKRLEVVASQSLNSGVEFYQSQQYAQAYRAFTMSSDINQKYFNRLDTLAIYNAALAADKAGDRKSAVSDYRKLTDVNYGGAKMYSLLTRLYLDQSDTTNALATLSEGRKKYPEDGTLITQTLNIYLNSGKDKEAYEQNEAALRASPSNPVLHYIKGNLADKLGKNEEAVAAYKKAIEIKPDYFDAVYNLGAKYFNEGAEMANKANSIPPSKIAEYDAAKKKFEAKFKEALPYLEKAHELNPSDAGTMQSLKQLYTRLGDLVKAGEMKKKLEATH